jgi:D-alanine-D-alanine ligase
MMREASSKEGIAVTGMGKKRIAVLYGGRADEHSISCISAGNVLRSIDREKFDPIPIGVTKEGEWIVGGEDPTKWALGSSTLPEVRLTQDSHYVVLNIAQGADGFWADADRAIDALDLTPDNKSIYSLGHIDAIFPAFHGPYGEDGTVQGLLEVLGVPYVGCGVFASAACMDKHFTKILLESAGLRVTPWITLDTRKLDSSTQFAADAGSLAERVADAGLTYPLFVKPSREGSSFGVGKVEAGDPAELSKAVFEASKHDWKVLVESGVVGAHEIECAVLAAEPGEPAQTAWPGEIVLGHVDDGQFYDFDSKYIDSGAEHNEIPAHLPDETLQKVREVAAKAFEAVDGEGLARVDTFVKPDGTVIVNEINTMPGSTSISMFPQAWEVTGIPYSEVITRLIEGVL